MSPLSITVHTGEGVFLYANQKTFLMHGYTREEFLALNLRDVDVPATASLIHERMRQITEKGEAAFEVEHLRKDGSSFPLEVFVRVIDWGGQKAMLSLATDITERRRAEEALRKSEERYREIFEGSRDGFVVVDVDGAFLHANRAYCEMLGYSNEELSRMRDFYEITPARWREWERVEIWENRLLKRGYSGVYEKEYIRKDGSVFPVELQSYTVFDACGKPRYLWGFASDITDRKKAEAERALVEQKLQQTQRLESLGVLAGGIAHDFNNLLTVIMGNANLALSDLPGESPARASIEEVERATRRAADLTRQMLAYAGKGRMVSGHLDISQVVGEMTQILKTVVSRKAALSLNLEQNLPLIQGDPSQVRQVVMNLIINASEALGDRDGAIAISSGVRECDSACLCGTAFVVNDLPPGRYVYFEVSDNGCGMDEETLSRAFEPFFTTKFTGRGLGLSAVMGIMRSHRGLIQVSSQPGKGTTFRVYFPALPIDTDRPGDSPETGSSQWRGNGTVLMIDDEEPVRFTGQRLLERLGFHVVTAEDGQAGLETLRARGEEIRLVLCDMTMPRMDGGEAFREMHKLRPGVPIVMTSGYGEEDMIARFAGEEPAGFIQKPFTLEALRELLQKALVRREG